MTITTISNEELDKNPSRAKKATNNGPVFIVEDGRQAFVLLTIEEYRRINKEAKLRGDRFLFES